MPRWASSTICQAACRCPAEKARGQALPEKDLLAGQAKVGATASPPLPQQEQVSQMSGQLAHRKIRCPPWRNRLAHSWGDGGAVPGMEGASEVGEQFLSGQSQHFAGHGAGEVVAAQGQGLVQRDMLSRTLPAARAR